MSQMTDWVSTRMYQPRIRVSISKAQEVSRSAGHMMRKERTAKGARKDGRAPGAVRVAWLAMPCVSSVWSWRRI